MPTIPATHKKGAYAVWWIAAFALLAVLTAAALYSTKMPPPVRQVIDETGLLQTADADFIAAYHDKLLEDHDIDYRVSVVAGTDTETIEQLSHRLFRDIASGNRSKSGRLLLLVIDPNGQQIRLEVSALLEGVYTDHFISYIQHRQMVPFFKSGQVAQGILATTELVFTRAQEAEEGKSFIPPTDAENVIPHSIGGGASNTVAIGSGADNTFRQSRPAQQGRSAALQTPQDTLAAYRTALEARNGNPDLPLYSRASREMMRRWTVTPAQMDNEAKSIRRCPPAQLKALAGHAVLRRPVEARQCPPYFFILEDDAWRLDLTMMQTAIRFNHRNEWHFVHGVAPHPYVFAFDDWRLDKNGYPHTMPKLRWDMTVGTYQDTGTIVLRVGADSPAARLGFARGDRILIWENIKEPHHSQITRRMDELEPQEPFKVKIQRGGQTFMLEAKAPPRP